MDGVLILPHSSLCMSQLAFSASSYSTGRLRNGCPFGTTGLSIAALTQLGMQTGLEFALRLTISSLASSVLITSSSLRVGSADIIGPIGDLLSSWVSIVIQFHSRTNFGMDIQCCSLTWLPMESLFPTLGQLQPPNNSLEPTSELAKT